MSQRLFTGALNEEIAQREGSAADPARKALLRKAALGILSLISEGLQRDQIVRLHRFGTFRLKPVAARRGRNPQTGEPILIPAHRRVVFTPAKALLERVEPTPQKPLICYSDSTTNLPPTHTKAAFEAPEEATASPASHKEPDSPDSRWPWFGVAAGVIAIALWLSFQTPQRETTVAQTTQPVPSLATTTPAISIPDHTAEPITRIDPSNNIEPVDSTQREYSTETPTETSVSTSADAVQAPAEAAIAEHRATTTVDRESSTAAPPFFAARDYRVVEGDTLWHLSGNHYREPIYWPHICRANLSTITDPDRIYRGDRLTLPTLYGEPDALTAEDRATIAEGYYTVYRYYESQGHPEAIYALIGARWFDQAVFEKHRPQINRQRLRIMELSSLYGDTVPKLLAATFNSP